MRLKELRQAAGYSQAQLAELLKTSQQTIGRWESGAAEPNLQKLRDLAMIFGVGIDDLLGKTGAKPATTTYHLFGDGVTDGFWGHVGLLLDGRSQSIWFPVTVGTVQRLESALSGDADWVSFPTLANNLVAFRPETVRKISLLDDAADGPDGDWTQDFPYQGLPLETYRAFGTLSETPLDKADWEEAVAALPKRDRKGDLQPGDPDKWKAFSDELAAETFQGEASDDFIRIVASAFVEAGLHDSEAYYSGLHYSQIHLVGGEEHAFWVENESLAEFTLDVDIEVVPRLVRFEQFGGAPEVYFPSRMLSAVVMPLIDVMEAQGSPSN